MEDVVSELVLGEFNALCDESVEYGFLGVGLPILDDGLDCSGAVLVPGPPGCLVETCQDLLLGSEVGVVVVSGDADRVVAVVLFFGLETQSGLGRRATCGNCQREEECSLPTSCEKTSQSRTCPARGRSGLSPPESPRKTASEERYSGADVEKNGRCRKDSHLFGVRLG